jgi:uncharacterized membrane protein YbhN (UPF0104 family)
MKRKAPSALTIIKWVFAAAVVVFGALYIVDNATQLGKAVHDLNPWGALIALVLTFSALIMAFVSWLVLWPAIGIRLPWRPAARVFFVSQTGKYVPGSIWPIAAQATMARSVGLKRTSSIVLSLISMAVSIAVGLAFGSAIAISAKPSLFATYPWVVVLAVVFIIALAPRIVRWAAGLATRVMRQGKIDLDYGWGTAAKSSGAQLGNWILSGLHLWVILIALGADPWTTLLPALAAFPVGFALGVLLIPFPAGLGVREFVIGLMLASVVGAPTAVAAALVSRVIFAIADFSMAGITILAFRRSLGPLPQLSQDTELDAPAEAPSATRESD